MSTPIIRGDKIIDSEYTCGCTVGLHINEGAFADHCPKHRTPLERLRRLIIHLQR